MQSEPRGPVYLTGSREAMEEEIEPYSVDRSFWSPIQYGALNNQQVRAVANPLLEAKDPLLIIGYGGRNPAMASVLVQLADLVPGLRVLDTAGSDMCFPASHPAWLGVRMGSDESITTADLILVVDCDVPWINTQCKPKADAVIIHIDIDPLKESMSLFYINAIARFRVNSEMAIKQVVDYVQSTSHEYLSSQVSRDRRRRLEQSYQDRLESINEQAFTAWHLDDGSFSCAYLIRELRQVCPRDTIWVVEAVTNSVTVADQIQATLPGSWINCGGGGLGWSGGGKSTRANTDRNTETDF